MHPAQIASREATVPELSALHDPAHVDAMNLVERMSERQRMVAAAQ